jgi:hypothetical protein
MTFIRPSEPTNVPIENNPALLKPVPVNEQEKTQSDPAFENNDGHAFDPIGGTFEITPEKKKELRKKT